MLSLAHGLLLESCENEEERVEVNRAINTKKVAGAPSEPDAPAWWHGDEAALVEAQNFQSWLRKAR